MGDGGWGVLQRGIDNRRYGYYHMLQRPFVNAGQFVMRSVPLGLLGSTGYSSGPHLHFSVTAPGGTAWIDPLTVFPASANMTRNLPHLNMGEPHHRAYANGGWITEPVAGIGLRTGTSYSLGENEAEYVTPRSRIGGTQPQTVINNDNSIHLHNVNYAHEPEMNVRQHLQIL